MRKKLTTIYNTVDMSLFHENGGVSTTGAIPETNAFRIVVAASYHEKKNMLNVARSLLLLKNEGVSNGVIVDWYGADQPDGRPLEKARQFVAENNLENHLRFHNSTRIIHLEYARCDAVGLFSLFEGLPNAVCEGMASGKPIIISNVCDAGNLVRDGRNGFLVEPTCPRSIADGIKRLVSMSSQQRIEMGIESRKMAAELFNEDAIAARYEEVLIAALHRRNPSPHCMWPDKVPDSAIRSALALKN